MKVTPRQAVSAILLIAVILAIIVPSLSFTSLILEVTGEKIDGVRHLYVAIEKIEIHLSGTREGSAWYLISESVVLDLAEEGSPSNVRIERSLPIGKYDKIAVNVANVTVVSDEETTLVEISQKRIGAPLNIELDAGDKAGLKITLSYDHDALLSESRFLGVITVSEL
ncbi:MAG: DUF4382 domain-containing protein [Candidatus Bathyarchaeia archaeon]